MGKRKRGKAGSTPKIPAGCHHYQDIANVPWDIQKYYHQRHSIFSRYDEGIWMTDDAWFGVTPEPVALKIAVHLAEAAPAEKAFVIDVFAGAGGNTIAFALSNRWKRVYAIEKDPQVLACAKQNAEVYGVADRISWLEGDSFEIMPKHLGELGEMAVIFASPPWGGPGYRHDEIFDVSQMQPYSIDDLLNPLQKISRDIALYLPRTSDLRQIAEKATSNEKVNVVHYCMEGASKALCAYFGALGNHN
ncbi:hypothetical protein MMC25_006369 [Agyrium rufum]|nr:hypothetical protein [Agyrium rufum]